jgi:hypothetical protein
MATTKKTDREKFDEAVRKAAEPVPVEDREPSNETILYGEDAILDTRDFEVDIVDTDGVAVAPEVHVTTDAPQYEASVLMPPEGIGTPDLPGWALIDAERVEDVFAREASEAGEVKDDERAKAAADGRTPEGTRGKPADKS